MGYIFEEIIRKFSESHNADAGQFYTPREVIELMTNILFVNDENTLSRDDASASIYDPACGTGGMLSVSEEHIKSFNADAELFLYGQELNAMTWAICQSDLLIKNNNARPDRVIQGDTLTEDGFAEETFEYILSNPPFGGKWGDIKEEIEIEHKRGFEGRFGGRTSDNQRQPNAFLTTRYQQNESQWCKSGNHSQWLSTLQWRCRKWRIKDKTIHLRERFTRSHHCFA